MADGKLSMMWDLQSATMSHTANLQIPKGKKKTTPSDFNYYQKAKAKPKTKKQPKQVLSGMAAMVGLSPQEQAKLERLLAEKERRLKDANAQHQDR